MTSDYECRYFYLYSCNYWRRILRGATSWLCIKEDSQAIATIVGLFIAGLAYLQYQHVASFDWNRIEGLLTSTLGNITNQVASNLDVAVLGMSTLGIPSTGNMTAGFAVGFMRG